MQEAYRPRLIKYSMCCPVPWGGGTPGNPPPAGVSPRLGYPPILTCLGGYPGQVPPPRCGQTDRHVSKHNLPVVLRTRSVKMGNFNLEIYFHFSGVRATCISLFDQRAKAFLPFSVSSTIMSSSSAASECKLIPPRNATEGLRCISN